jgi:hypothetical protein
VAIGACWGQRLNFNFGWSCPGNLSRVDQSWVEQRRVEQRFSAAIRETCRQLQPLRYLRG